MSRRSAAAFTLVELLVALAIFALMTAFAYRGLGAMLDGREALQRESRKWRDVALFVGRLERDLSAVLDRQATNASGTAMPAVTSTVENANGLALTRSGATIMENALAAPMRVAYRLNGARVERLAWNGVDAAPREEPRVVPLMEPVAGLTFRFLDPATGEWRTTWGPAATDAPPPAAVEVTLVLASGERIVRLMDLVRR